VNPKPKFNWKQIDPLLLLACLAPDAEKRERLLSRLVQRYRMNRLTLLRRLDFLGARFVPRLLGPGALENYERNMLMAIEGEKLYCQMRSLLMTNVERLRAEQESRSQRSLSLREAASLLRVRQGLLRNWILDLGVMRPDDKGKIPIEEIRQFMSSDWKWLLPAKRLQRSALRRDSENEEERAIADSWRKPGPPSATSPQLQHSGTGCTP
jgi:hypothetical protein